MADPNSMVIGSNLYFVLKSFPSSFIMDYLCELAQDRAHFRSLFTILQT
jgi:hypothetical protein